MQTVFRVDNYDRRDQTVAVHGMNMVGALLEAAAGQEAGVLLLAGSSHVADIMLAKASVDIEVLALLLEGSSLEFLLYLSTFDVLVVLLATVVSDVF